MALLLFLSGAAVLAGLWLSPPARKARAYTRKVSASGYLAPRPSMRAARWAARIGGIVVFIWVGKVRVIGIENLNTDGAPLMITPNHSHGGDPFVMAKILNRPMRYMAGAGFMRVLGLFAASMGAYSIDVKNRKGRLALDSSVTLLSSGQSICLYPEGELFLPVGTFKMGAVLIAKETARQQGKPVLILPVLLRYGRYPGRWAHKLPDNLRYTLPLYNPFWYRRGVTVVFGKPYLSSDLPANFRKAAKEMRQRVLELDPVR